MADACVDDQSCIGAPQGSRTRCQATQRSRVYLAVCRRDGAAKGGGSRAWAWASAAERSTKLRLPRAPGRVRDRPRQRRRSDHPQPACLCVRAVPRNGAECQHAATRALCAGRRVGLGRAMRGGAPRARDRQSAAWGRAIQARRECAPADRGPAAARLSPRGRVRPPPASTTISRLPSASSTFPVRPRTGCQRAALAHHRHGPRDQLLLLRASNTPPVPPRLCC